MSSKREVIIVSVLLLFAAFLFYPQQTTPHITGFSSHYGDFCGDGNLEPWEECEELSHCAQGDGYDYQRTCGTDCLCYRERDYCVDYVGQSKTCYDQKKYCQGDTDCIDSNGVCVNEGFVNSNTACDYTSSDGNSYWKSCSQAGEECKKAVRIGGTKYICHVDQNGQYQYLDENLAQEYCNDGIDNNCDGQIDEGCDQFPLPTCVPYDPQQLPGIFINQQEIDNLATRLASKTGPTWDLYKSNAMQSAINSIDNYDFTNPPIWQGELDCNLRLFYLDSFLYSRHAAGAALLAEVVDPNKAQQRRDLAKKIVLDSVYQTDIRPGPPERSECNWKPWDSISISHNILALLEATELVWDDMTVQEQADTKQWFMDVVYLLETYYIPAGAQQSTSQGVGFGHNIVTWGHATVATIYAFFDDSVNFQNLIDGPLSYSTNYDHSWWGYKENHFRYDTKSGYYGVIMMPEDEGKKCAGQETYQSYHLMAMMQTAVTAERYTCTMLSNTYTAWDLNLGPDWMAIGSISHPEKGLLSRQQDVHVSPVVQCELDNDGVCDDGYNCYPWTAPQQVLSWKNFGLPYYDITHSDNTNYYGDANRPQLKFLKVAFEEEARSYVGVDVTGRVLENGNPVGQGWMITAEAHGWTFPHRTGPNSGGQFNLMLYQNSDYDLRIVDDQGVERFYQQLYFSTGTSDFTLPDITV